MTKRTASGFRTALGRVLTMTVTLVVCGAAAAAAGGVALSVTLAFLIPYGARLDVRSKHQGMRASIRLLGWPSRIARRVWAM